MHSVCVYIFIFMFIFIHEARPKWRVKRPITSVSYPIARLSAPAGRKNFFLVSFQFLVSLSRDVPSILANCESFGESL